MTTPLYVQKARILATYVRLVKRGDDRLAAARSKGERARTRWREGAKLAVAWAREQASRAATEARCETRSDARRAVSGEEGARLRGGWGREKGKKGVGGGLPHLSA